MNGYEMVPIAIIGVSCHFPGKVNSPSHLWDLLKAGCNTWSHVPADRYNESAFIHSSSDDANGSHNHIGGHFLDHDVRDFDNGFFNISSQEAAAMDPQQRLLLETVYEALESAGQQQDNIRGTDTSVHISMFTRDYDRNIFKDTLNIPRHHIVGNGEAILANRISHVFDLRGPSMVLDTGCSGGLVAVHYACQALRLGEVNMAIAGAANLILSPDHQIGMSNLHMLNEDGRSYPFDSRGSGYGRGEGFATLILKRLDKAIAEKDPIRAVILGSAVNQDGRTAAGITYPSAASQETLQKKLYQQLDVDPSSIVYVEAHGTGTAAGDYEEISALTKTFCVKRTSPLYVGSIKSNIGHLESTSGLAGLIKGLLVLENGQIVPNADFKHEKEGLSLRDRKIIIPTSLVPFPRTPSSRISVNSFGYGGTNAHVILGSAPYAKLPELLPHTCAKAVPRLFVLSAKTQSSLKNMISRLHAWILAQDSSLSLPSLSYTLCNRRSHYLYRLSIVAHGRQDLLDRLREAAKIHSYGPSQQRVSINFVFTGQGAQWPQMGRQLLVEGSQSVFTESIQRSRDILISCGASWDLVEEILRNADETQIHIPEIAQPATTAIQIALVDLLESVGTRPSAVIGHSSGEIAAAYSAGYISHSTALQISFHRGFAPGISQKKGYPRGAMLVVGAGENEVVDFVNEVTKGTVAVACINSPQSTTVSGDEDAIDELAITLSSKNIFNRKLKVAAYHSYHMRAAAYEYKDRMGVLATQSPPIPIKYFSTVNALQKYGAFDADYWIDNLVSKVRFQEAILKLYQAQAATRQVFIEIGPHNALAGPTRQCIAGLAETTQYDYLSPLKRVEPALQTLLGVVGKLFEHGQEVHFSAISSFDPEHEITSVLHDLPTYSWDHSKKHWHESRLSRDYRLRKHPYHDLLGIKIPESTTIEPRWRHMISITSQPWLADHVVDGLIVFPGAGYMCMVIEAILQLARDLFPCSLNAQVTLRDIKFLKAFLVPDRPHRTEAQLSFSSPSTVSPKSDNLCYQFRIAAWDHNQIWNEYCRGEVELNVTHVGRQGLSNGVLSPIEPCLQQSETYSCEEVYQQLRVNGNIYGPSFAGIQSMSMSNDHAISSVAIPDIAELMPAKHLQPHTIHPTTLDAIMHSSLPLATQKLHKGSVMPVHIEELTISTEIKAKPGEILTVEADVVSTNSRSATVDVEVHDDRKVKTTLTLYGMELRILTSEADVMNSEQTAREICWEMFWNLDVDFLWSNGFIQPTNLSMETNSLRSKVEILGRVSASFIRRCLSLIDSRKRKVTEQHQLLFEWMQRFQRESPCYFETSQAFSNDDLSPDMNHRDAVEMELVTRTGNQLSEIISGSVKALDIVLEDNLLYRAYRDDSSLLCYELLRQYVKHLCFKKSAIRVLEVCAGTGGATLPFLQATREFGFPKIEYEFTDISTGFFDQAAKLLSDYPITYRRFDIEKDPVQQGFEKEGYDVILACNGLHTSSSIQTALQNMCSLLKPDGRLAVIEVVNAQPYHHITFGTLPGYWKGSADGRMDGPFMTVEAWRSAMELASLQMQLSANDDDVAHTSSLMIAQRSHIRCGAEQTVHIVSVRDAHTDFISALQARLQLGGVNAVVDKFDHDVLNDIDIKIVLDDGTDPILANPSPDDFERVCAMLKRPARIIWISGSRDSSSYANPRKHLITGMSRSAHAENDNLHLITVDIQQLLDHTNERLLGFLNKCLHQTFLSSPGSTEREYIFRDDSVLIPRLLPSNAMNAYISKGRHAFPPTMRSFTAQALALHNGDARELTSPCFLADEEHLVPLSADRIEIQVQALSFSPSRRLDSSFYEYSGIVIAVGQQVTHFRVGDRVMAISTTPCASKLRVPACHAVLISDEISFTVAAAIPLALMCACYILFDLVDIRPSQRIAIQGIDDLVGQALSVVARHYGVYCVMISPERTEHSGRGTEHLLADRIVQLDPLDRKTAISLLDKLDLIIRCDTTRISKEVLACLKPFGSVVSVQRGGEEAPDFGHATQARPNITLHNVDFDGLIQAKPLQATTLLRRVSELAPLAYAALTKFPLKVEGIGEIHNVIKATHPEHNHKRVVLEASENSLVPVIDSQNSKMDLGSGTVIVAGGLGDLGRRLLSHLAGYGAKNLIAVSRRSPGQEELDHLQARLHALNAGCKIHHIQCDIAHEDQVNGAVATVASMGLPPIIGVVQSALTLQDRTLDSMSVQDFQIPLETKVDGTLNLQRAFFGSNLKFFIMLSSAVNILGTSGQANYNAGNAVQDALAHSAASDGCHYLAFSPGMIEGADITRDNDTRTQALHRSGLTTIRTHEIERMLEFLFSDIARTHRPAQIVAGFDAQSLSQAMSVNYNSNSAMFTHVLDSAYTEGKQGNISQEQSFRNKLETCNLLDEVVTYTAAAVRKKLASLLLVEAELMDMEKPILDFGLDSLIAIELRNWVRRDFEASLQSLEILQERSIRTLAEKIVAQSRLVEKPLV